MDKELYIGVDVSKKPLDLAYYDGETIDWKNAHLKVDNDAAGFQKIASWLMKIANGSYSLLFCMEYTGLYNQDFRQWLENHQYTYGMVDPRKMHRFEPGLSEGQRSLDRVKTDSWMPSASPSIVSKIGKGFFAVHPSFLPQFISSCSVFTQRENRTSNSLFSISNSYMTLAYTI